MDYSQLGSAELAYLGDAVLELLVREHLLKLGKVGAGRLNTLSQEFVKATAQSAALENILPLFSEEEEGVFRRARNNSKLNTPKSATAVEYRRATGFEAVFGYLYLSGRQGRIDELFKAAYGITDKTDQ